MGILHACACVCMESVYSKLRDRHQGQGKVDLKLEGVMFLQSPHLPASPQTLEVDLLDVDIS